MPSLSGVDASSLQNAALGQQIGIAVAAKGLDAAKAQGRAVVAMLDDAAQLQAQMANASPNLGRRIDARG